MPVADVVVQRWLAKVVAGLENKDSTRQKPSTVLRALKTQRITSALRRDLTEHLSAAGVECDPSPASWSKSTRWIIFRRISSSEFQLSFSSEKELSEFVVANWQRVPFLSSFASCTSQYRLRGGDLRCDLLFARPRGQGVVVVELKKGKPGNESVTELFGYVAAWKEEHPRRPVEAWLVTGKHNEALVDDLEALAREHDVKTRWFTYGVSFNLRALR